MIHGQLAMDIAMPAAGDGYDGDWEQDKRHGKGVYTWPDGTSHFVSGFLRAAGESCMTHFVLQEGHMTETGKRVTCMAKAPGVGLMVSHTFLQIV